MHLLSSAKLGKVGDSPNPGIVSGHLVQSQRFTIEGDRLKAGFMS